MKRKFDAYNVFLHLSVLGLALITVFLTILNRDLRKNCGNPLGVDLLRQGDSVGSVNLVTLENANIRFDFSKQERKTALLIFNSTCKSCAENTSKWIELDHLLKSRDIAVVGICLQSVDKAKKYIVANKIPFSVYVPKDSSFLFEFKPNAIPLTILLRPNGKVEGVWPGVLNDSRQDEIERLASTKY